MNESLQNKCLEKVLNSREFANSKLDQSYLTYLVNASNQNTTLKEITIAIDVFCKDSSFNPAEDTIVRSHTYSLRKKLERYYLSEGKDDHCRLRIPKGHYRAEFFSTTNLNWNAGTLLPFFKKHLAALLLMITLLSLIIVFVQYQSQTAILEKYQKFETSDPYWHDYLNSTVPVMVVVGDHFFINDYSETYKNTIAVRHPKINSEEDLQAFQNQHPDSKIVKCKEPYFPYHSIWSLPPVLSMLNSFNITPILRKSSDISPQILNENNLIFLGSIKTLYALKHTLALSHFDFNIAPHEIIYHSQDGADKKLFKTTMHSHGPNEDLVLAIKLPGPSNNAIFIICSYHSLGAPEIVQYMLDSDRRKNLDNKFENKFGKVPDYFEVLFRVTGIDRTAYNTEILIFNQLEPALNTR